MENYIVTVKDCSAEDMAKVVKQMEKAGATVSNSFVGMGVIILATDKPDEIKKISAVESFKKDEIVELPPSDSEVQ